MVNVSTVDNLLILFFVKHIIQVACAMGLTEPSEVDVQVRRRSLRAMFLRSDPAGQILMVGGRVETAPSSWK